ncbi:MAG TPA: hypothetical protein VK035_03015 [Kiloniellales bacterium]|nr:hypothetical protein [Kiloniellales bacterium]
MRLSVKIAVYMVGVIAFALILLTYLTNAKFRSLQEEVERSRFMVLALDIKATAERGLALGLDLEQMNNLAGILERLRAEHPDILSLQIISSQGDRLHATGSTPVEQPLGKLLERLEPQATSESGRAIELPGEAAFGFALPLVNSFGQAVGAVVLHYDRAASDAATRAVTLEQLRFGILVLLLAGVAALALARIQLRGLTRSFARMTHLVEKPVEEPETPPDSADAMGDDLTRRLQRVRAQAQELESKVAKAENLLAGKHL